MLCFVFFFQAEDGIRDLTVTGVQTCALPIWLTGDVRPQVAVKGAELALQREERPRVAHGGLDLQAVAHDAGIAPQGGAAACIEARHLARLEVGERAAVAGALARSEERRVGKECRSRWA